MRGEHEETGRGEDVLGQIQFLEIWYPMSQAGNFACVAEVEALASEGEWAIASVRPLLAHTVQHADRCVVGEEGEDGGENMIRKERNGCRDARINGGGKGIHLWRTDAGHG